MNGELAQLVALVAHTRAALSGEPFSLDLSNSTFKYLATLSFDVQHRRLFRQPVFESVARTPKDWYERVVRQRCRTALLVIGPSSGNVPAHVASAFASGGHWGTILTDDKTHTLWRAEWTVGDRKAAVDSKIWDVHYREFPVVPAANGDSISDASVSLGRLLQTADDFARDAALDSWRSWFQSARQKLESESAAFEYHSDMLPSTGYAPEARALLSAAERAWVFGGMGSWNDLGFPELELQERYDSLTPKLYEAVLKAIAAAVNYGI